MCSTYLYTIYWTVSKAGLDESEHSSCVLYKDRIVGLMGFTVSKHYGQGKLANLSDLHDWQTHPSERLHRLECHKPET